MLNLGCGYKTHWAWNNVDFSPYARLAHHQTLARILKGVGLLSEERYKKLLGVDPGIILWDLRKGIPFEDGTFDVVYHSHVLEHIPRNATARFLQECHRVLKQGGIIRLVVPDLHAIVRRYVSSVLALEEGEESAWKGYERALYDLFDQMVREEAASTSEQRPVVRFLERLIRGDAAKAGELHHWMYDEHSLRKLLTTAGFQDCRKEMCSTSRIDGWNGFCLDTKEGGSPYKRDSLYMEAVK
jgi:SAM-dependent methyltransferase